MTSQRTCLTESWIISLTRKQTWLTSNLFLLAWIIFFTGGLRGRRLWGLSGLSPSFPFGALPLFFSLAVSSSCCLAIICSRWTLQGRRTVSHEHTIIWAAHQSKPKVWPAKILLIIQSGASFFCVHKFQFQLACVALAHYLFKNSFKRLQRTLNFIVNLGNWILHVSKVLLILNVSEYK